MTLQSVQSTVLWENLQSEEEQMPRNERCCRGSKVSGTAASVVGKRRSVRTIAQ
jgi:hypothetical protein